MLLNKRTKHVVAHFSESGEPPPDISSDMPAAELINAPLLASNRSSGIDELNLAEFPLTHLGSRSDAATTTLEFRDQVFDDRSKQPVQRSLVVSGSPLYGLPGPTDADVLLTLLHMTSLRNAFQGRRVEFTRYELVQFLGWDPGGASYRRLDTSLQRWTSVTLQYKQAWWDRTGQRWKNQSFHILESLSLHGRADASEDRLSSFTWSEAVFTSCQVGNLKRLDLNQYFTLQRPAARQLFRFLDKRFYHSRNLEFPLRTLACEHVGLSRSYDAYDLKRRLQPAIEELEAIGFLQPLSAASRYRRQSKGQWNVVLTRTADTGRQQINAALVQELTVRGIAAATASRLVKAFAASRIEEKLHWHDQLRLAGDRRVARNPAGFLRAAIQRDFHIPSRDQLRSRSTDTARRATQTDMQLASQPAGTRVNEATAQHRLEHARQYWQQLSDAQQQLLEARLLKHGKQLQVEVFRRQPESSALRDELRYSLLADYLERTEQPGTPTAIQSGCSRPENAESACTARAAAGPHTQPAALEETTVEAGAAECAVPDASF